MPIPYNPERAYQPARLVDVHAELVQTIRQRRRDQRHGIQRRNRERYMEVPLPPADDMEVEYLLMDEL